MRQVLGRLMLIAGIAPVLCAPTRAQVARKPQPRPSAAQTVFEDVTAKAGIRFHLTCGSTQKLYILETLCGGVALFDYDRDGWTDIFLVNGSTLEALRNGQHPGSKLYRNNRDGTFTDVTDAAGLTAAGWGHGAAVGDFDNDGWPDLYVTYFTGGRLFRNTGKAAFADVTAAAGVGNEGRWGTSAAFGDYDHDGFLDLYIANYVDLDLDRLPAFGSGPFCQYRGIAVSCGPRGLAGSRDRLYRNNGDGTFTDVTEKLKIDPQAYYGLGVIWGDVNGDGCQDVYVANDSSPSLLYLGDCKGGLKETGITAGVAYSEDGREQAGMGVDLGDYDNDGRPDLAKTNFSDDSNNLYRNNGDGSFTDMAGPSGFGPVSVPLLGFGVRFLDFDNDGWKDAFVANGHVNPQVDQHSFGVTYAQRSLLFRNLGNGRLEEIGERAGRALAGKRVSRGLAVADFDNDGRLDLLLTNLDDSPTLLRNVARGSGHWLRLRTIGAKCNRDAFGARIEVTTGALVQSDEVRASSSYLSSSDTRLHFGLGKSSRADRIVVRWPSGATDTLRDVPADQEIVIEEGKGIVPVPSQETATSAGQSVPAERRPVPKL
ncbi:MAG TPA: CRTAC1 family protein [Terriglobales bacterium]|nr:CRTAC1 family protein [Terriglobales bacterium]